SPWSAIRSKRDPAMPRTVGSARPVSARFTSPRTRRACCHSRSTATSPLPACGALRDSGSRLATDARSTSSTEAETCQSPVRVTPRTGAAPAISVAPSAPCAVSEIRLAAARGRDAHAAERELRSEPTPTRVHLREIERKAQLSVHPGLEVIAIARDLREQEAQRERADEGDQHSGSNERERDL